MKKSHLLLLLVLLGTCLTNSAFAASWEMKDGGNFAALFNEVSLNEQLYTGLELESYGLSRDAVDYAVEGYEYLLEQGMVTNAQYLSIVDFSQPLVNRRFYLLDVANKQLVSHTFVMHGKATGGAYAQHFSNKINSHQSSLGFYLTKYTYKGSRGYSLRLSGLEPGFNSNAEARGVVVHGSSYINETRALAGKVERSLGCPALPQDESRQVIDMIRDGSVFFIYHPSEDYLRESAILNPE